MHNPSSEYPGGPIYLGIGLVAGAAMLFEITLIRVFSFIIWHHFAFVVISTALLGFGISGVLLQLRGALGDPPRSKAAWYAALFGLSAVAATALVCRVPFAPAEISRDPVQFYHLLIYYIGFSVPFIFAGLCVVTLLNGFASRIDRLYACDLSCAGLCSGLAVAAFRSLGAEGLVMLAASFAALAAAILQLDQVKSSGARGMGRAMVFAAAALALFALVPAGSAIVKIQPGSTKSLSALMDRKRFPNTRVIYTRWSAIGRVDALRNAGSVIWTGNAIAGTRSPRELLLVIDGDAGTPIVPFDGDITRLSFLDYMLPSAALQAFRPRRCLVLGSGGGVDVLAALRNGAEQADAVEVNDVIDDLVTGQMADFGGRLFQRKGVTLHRAEGRSFVRSQSRQWDSIQLSLVDTWAASSSGAYALTESYLYTVEAFEDYLRHLSQDGILTLTRWITQTPREILRLMVIASEALRRMGYPEPANHMALLRLGSLGNLIVKREAMSSADIDALRRVAAKRGLSLVYAPGIGGDNDFIRYFRAPDRRAFVNDYVFDISPAVDDSPFFFQFGRWKDLARLGSVDWGLAGTVSGRLLLVAVFLQALIISLCLLVLPSWKAAQADPAGAPAGSRQALPALGYFFLVGLGFMLVEVTLMQRFTLFLGHPIYAVALVLAALLGFAGMGSFFSRRFAPAPRGIFFALTALVLIYALALPPIFRWSLGMSAPARLLMGALFLLPMGFLLGMPFPLAMARLAENRDRRIISWAWAANGFASVIGPVMAALLAFDLGYTAVTMIAGALYATAYFAFRPLWAPN